MKTAAEETLKTTNLNSLEQNNRTRATMRDLLTEIIEIRQDQEREIIRIKREILRSSERDLEMREREKKKSI